MPPKKRPHTVSVDLELMKTHLECPVCFEIPSDGVMLLCQNSHDICATCKTKMDDDRSGKCPQGDCDYDNPPRRNRTVAGLVDRLPLEFACKYAAKATATAAASGCEFVGTKKLLGQHEEACHHRPVPCPAKSCEESVSANNVIEHLKTMHGANPENKSSVSRDVFEKSCLWNKEKSSNTKNSACTERIHLTTAGWVISCAHLWEGQVYTWLLMLAPKTEADKFKCLITLKKDDCSMNFPAPVYPIDWTRKMIMQDEHCVCLNNYSIRQVLNEGVHEDNKKIGYNSKFEVTFKIVKKTV
jgi:hypothetical protein